MNGSIHQFLDGERSLDSLTPDAREQATRLQAVIAAATERTRSFPAPDLTAAVMAAIPAAPDPARRALTTELFAWLWTPVRLQLRLRPVYGMMLAAAAVALALFLPPALLPTAGPVDAPVAVSPSASIFVQFRLEAPGASSVALAGSFTQWEPRVELHQAVPGVWTAMVPLSPGVHDYTFVIDGTLWVPDPHALRVDDSFGGLNSRITLLPPSHDI